MSKPKSKDELIDQSQKNYQRLMDLIDGMPDSEKTVDFPPGAMNRNIRDVLGHLYEWHRMFLRWYEEGMQGKKPDIPAKGYSWKMTPELNKKIFDAYQSVDLDSVRKLLNESSVDIHGLINKHTNQELFEKKRYKWTGSTSLGVYLIGATSAHYDWAFKLIKKQKAS